MSVVNFDLEDDCKENNEESLSLSDASLDNDLDGVQPIDIQINSEALNKAPYFPSKRI